MRKSINEFKRKANNLLGYVRPRFSELTTFQAAITSILILYFYPEILTGIYHGVLKDLNSFDKPTGMGLLVFISFLISSVIGIFLSFWHVLVKKKKSNTEKWFMGTFAIFASGSAGVLATMELLPDDWSWLLLFPLWNFLWGLLLMDGLAAPHETITDEDASLLDVLVAIILVGLSFYVARFIMEYTWPVVFSMCMSVSSVIMMVYSRAIFAFKNYA